MNRIVSLVCGLLFGAGLAASGMTNTAKVIGFLDLFGNWDPDLLFVMGSAVVTTVVSFRFILKRSAPIFESGFSLPSSSTVDIRIIVGALLFGIGWGMYGYCPGPAVASIIYLQPVTIVFLSTMIGGMLLGNKLMPAK
jgi:uncharacterized membrane protein YedE/YeeE